MQFLVGVVCENKNIVNEFILLESSTENKIVKLSLKEVLTKANDIANIILESELVLPTEIESYKNSKLYFREGVNTTTKVPFITLHGDINQLPIYNSAGDCVDNNSLVIAFEDTVGVFYVVDNQLKIHTVNSNQLIAWYKEYDFYNYNSLAVKVKCSRIYPITSVYKTEFSDMLENLNKQLIVLKARCLSLNVDQNMFYAYCKQLRKRYKQYPINIFLNKKTQKFLVCDSTNFRLEDILTKGYEILCLDIPRCEKTDFSFLNYFDCSHAYINASRSYVSYNTKAKKLYGLTKGIEINLAENFVPFTQSAKNISFLSNSEYHAMYSAFSYATVTTEPGGNTEEIWGGLN